MANALRSAARWETLRDLCRLVGCWLKPGDPVSLPGSAGWEPLIEAASAQLVSPALAFALQGRSDVPKRVSDYFDGILYLNRDRNRIFLGGLETALQALNAAAIEPVLLKGAASLASELYPDPAMRILGDVDLLVPEGTGAKAVRALLSCGYEIVDKGVINYREHHHLAPMRDPESGLFIELHVRPLLRKWDCFLPAHSVLEQATPIGFQNGAVRLPTPTHRLIHAIVHDQLSDSNHAARRLDVRQMLELAALIDRYADAIDWRGLQEIFDRNGQRIVLQDTLEILDSLFGVRAPGLAHSSRQAVLALRREVDRSDAQWLFRRIRRDIRKHPFLLFRVFYPPSWTRVLMALRHQLHAERW